VSQVLTLFTTPVVYLFFDRLARRTRSKRAPVSVAGGHPVVARVAQPSP
jgi:hypothetical protein